MHSGWIYGRDTGCSLFAHQCRACLVYKRAQTNWCGRRKKSPHERQAEGRRWKMRERRDLGAAAEGQKENKKKKKRERERKLWRCPALLLIRLFISSENRSTSRVTVLTAQSRRARQEFNALWVKSISRETGQKAPALETPDMKKIELCGKARRENGRFCMKVNLIWGAESCPYDKCDPFISHSSRANPLQYSVDL